MRPRGKAIAWAIAPLVVLSSALLWLAGNFARQVATEERNRAQQALELDVEALQRTLDQIIGKLDSLAAFVGRQTAGGEPTDPGEFSTFAAGLHASSTWIRAFQVVRNGVITLTYPRQGNEAALGYDLLADPRLGYGPDVARAIETGRPTITGPLELLQGGQGIVLRRLVARPQGSPAVLVAVVLSIEPLLGASGLGKGSTRELRLAIRREGQPVFFGPRDVFDMQPVTRRLPLVDGSWEIGGIPPGGWSASSSRPVVLFYVAGAVIVALISILVFVLARSRAILEETVRVRTEALRHQLAARQEAQDQLTQNYALLRSVTEGVSDSVFVKDLQGRYQMMNSAGAAFLGRTPDAIIGRTDSELFPEGTTSAIEEGDRRVIESGQALTMEERGTAGGATRLYQSTKAPWRDPHGAIIGVVGVSRDITDHAQMEEALRESERIFQTLAEISPVGIFRTDANGYTTYANPRWSQIAGLPTAEALGLGWLRAVHPDDRERLSRSWDAASHAHQGTEADYRFVRPDGSIAWVMGQAVPDKDPSGEVIGYVGTITDVTDRKHVEVAMRASLLEKEALLKEVHHRVKNNLQVIASLLRLETGRSVEPAARTVLKDMKSRVQTMALLHETLYRSGTFASVDLGAYLRQLASQSFRSMDSSPGAVHLDLTLGKVEVGIDQAIPCGLILNELISNSLKHGFPGGRTGHLRVELLPDGDPSKVRLRVSDTGVGLPADFEIARASSLGLQLTSDLAKQLGGRLEIGPGPGAAFALVFEVAKRVDPGDSASVTTG